MKRLKRSGLGLIAWVLGVGTSLAQQVATDPASTHIFPAGGRRGTSVEVRVGGECLPPITRLRLLGSGVSAPELLGARAEPRGEPSLRRKPGELHINYPKEWHTRFEIADDAPLGACYWWLACARGGTGARVFLVGDLPECIETESNSHPARAEQIELPVTLNGQIDGERDLDFFRFSARAGESVVADVMAARLGSPLEVLLEFRDAAGKRLAVQETRVGLDPVVALKVPTDGEYQLLVANLGTPGGPHFVYRINLTHQPYPRLVYPGGGSAGQPLHFDLLTLTGTAEWGHASHMLSLNPEPGQSWWQPAGAAHALPIDVARLPEFVEPLAPEEPFGLDGPGNCAATATTIAIPAVINGRLETHRDEDWFRFEVVSGEALRIECRPAGTGLPILPVLSVHDASGGILAAASAIETPDRRPCLEMWTPPAAGTYWLRVRDVQQGVAGGPEFVYRVAIEPAQPDFELSLKTDAANHLQGGRTELDVLVRRRGGFSGPIQVSAEGLPSGMRAEPLEIPAGGVTGKLVLVSEENALPPPDDALLRIVGRADMGGASIQRVANMPHLSRDAEGVAAGPAEIDRFHLTVQNKPLFRLYCSEAYQYAHRGTIYPYLMEVERLNGFDGPIRLEIADRQNKDLDGVEVVDVTIPAGETQVMLPLYLPETMHINVQAHSNIYAQGIAEFHDALGRPQSTCVVSEMRCMVRTLPTVAKLQAVEPEMTVRPGETVTCHLRLNRTSLFGGPLKVTLHGVSPASGVSADPIEIASNHAEGTIELRIAPHAAWSDPFTLRLRGVGDLGDGATVITEAQLTLRIK